MRTGDSAFIAGYVRGIPGARVVLPGGSYDPDAQVMRGPLVGKCAEEFYVDKYFIGTDGYDPVQGFSNVDMLRVEAVRAMAKRAGKRIILTDSSKFGASHAASVCQDLSILTGIVTDPGLAPETRARLESAGLRVLC